MNVNDRISLELGRAHLARIIAEARADQAEARLQEAASAPAPRKRPAGKPKAPPQDPS